MTIERIQPHEILCKKSAGREAGDAKNSEGRFAGLCTGKREGRGPFDRVESGREGRKERTRNKGCWLDRSRAAETKDTKGDEGHMQECAGKAGGGPAGW
jgi:hypothetical protein